MPDSSQAAATPDGNTVACVECDLLVSIPKLGMRQRSLCPRCGEVLSHGNVQRARLALPYGICAALLLPLSLLFPFLSFARSGVSNEINLIQSAWALYLDGSVVLSGIVFTFIIILPACVVAAVIWVALSLNLNRYLQGVHTAARFIYVVTAWSMVEVFIIAVLVSLIKIAHMASVEMGLSLWSYVAFALFTVAALAKLDKYVVWNRIEALQR
jgi:paraquat-inducible protein A